MCLQLDNKPQHIMKAVVQTKSRFEIDSTMEKLRQSPAGAALGNVALNLASSESTLLCELCLLFFDVSGRFGDGSKLAENEPGVRITPVAIVDHLSFLGFYLRFCIQMNRGAYGSGWLHTGVTRRHCRYNEVRSQ